MNRLINNKKMDQNEALSSAIVVLSDEELEQVVGGSGGGFPCPAHRDWHEDENDCDRERNRRRCGRGDYGHFGILGNNDLVSDLLELL